MTSGSVILGENPINTIVREAKEELNIDINFVNKFLKEEIQFIYFVKKIVKLKLYR